MLEERREIYAEKGVGEKIQGNRSEELSSEIGRGCGPEYRPPDINSGLVT